MKKYVVYTALFGDYDELVEIPNSNELCCDYICFTDDPHLESDSWEIKVIVSMFPPNIMNRMYKILPHKFLSQYDASLYLDANFIIKKDLTELIVKYLKSSDFLALKHPQRDCVYQEGLACIGANKANFKSVEEQLMRYISVGFPAGYGLSANGVLLRAHNKSHMKELMNDWWLEVKNYSKRDQLSLQFLLWNRGIELKYMNENLVDTNPYFMLMPHKKGNVMFHYKWYKKLLYVIRVLVYYPKYYCNVFRLT